METQWKRFLPYVFLLLIVIILLIFIPRSCDVKVNDPIFAPTAIAFLDANPLNRTNVANVKVTLIDPQSLVVASSGLTFSEVELKQGVMNVGLKENPDIGRNNPYEFRIRAEAEGYITTMKTIILEDDSPKYIPVFMAAIDNPPAGMTTTSGSFAVDNSGVLQKDVIIQTSNKQQELPFTGRVFIPEGTQLLCHGEQPVNVTEEVKYKMSAASAISRDAARTFPNGFQVTNAVDASGQTIATTNDPFFFASAGWTTIDMELENVIIDGFDRPLVAELDISPNLRNPDTGELYKAGDRVPIWSLDDNTGTWTEENVVTLQERDSVLIGVFNIDHLSTWNLDIKVDACDSNISIEVQNDHTDPLLRYSELVEANTGTPFGITGVGSNRGDRAYNYPAAETETVTFANAPDDVEVAFVVYDNATTPDNVLATSQVFTTCNSPATNPDLTINDPAAPPIITIQTQVQIDDTAQPVCNNALWYKVCSSSCGSGTCSGNPFLYAGHVVSIGSDFGELRTALDIGEPYCMRFFYLGTQGATMIDESIEFSIDFDAANSDPDNPQTATSPAGTTVIYLYNSADDRYEITIEGGLSELDACTIR